MRQLTDILHIETPYCSTEPDGGTRWRIEGNGILNVRALLILKRKLANEKGVSY